MMKILPILLASTVLAASPAVAKKPRAHHSHSSQTVTMSKQQLDGIMSKMQSMREEIDALKAAQAANAGPAQNTQAAAQIQALQEKVDALQGAETATAQSAAAAQTEAGAAQTALKVTKDMAWAANTKISGKAYFNVSNIDQKSTDLAGVTSKSAANGTEAELKRFYLTIDHKFSPIFSASATTDFRYGTNGTSKDTLVYLKKAYLQATLAPEFYVRVGAADLPWVPFAESIYGYRFVENTLIDRTKFGTSTDWGVHAGGTFANGLVSYAVSAINGAGYKTLSRTSDTIDVEGRVSVNPIKPITLAVGGYTGKLGKSEADLPDTATPHTAERFNALAAYTDNRIRAGVEYFWAKKWTTVTSPAGDKADGWSAFASYAFMPQFSVFGRYDWVKPSQDLKPALKDNYFNAGVDYKPLPPLDLALVYKRDRVKNGTLSTSNGTIGGPAHGSYDEFGLWGQFAF
jgi:uncharacterized protein YigA (DUF484 family)